MLSLYKSHKLLCFIYVLMMTVSCGTILNYIFVPSLSAQINNTSDSSNVNINGDLGSGIPQWLQSMFPAIVAAIASVAAAIFAATNQTKLKKLEEWKAERDARREYEYEARKRLYRELEPVLFLLNEHSEDAYRHILQLATLARDGTLATNLTSPTKDNEDNYYLKSTIYTLILPMAIFRLLHSNLTLYDLELDINFKFQYILAKCLYLTCSNSFDIAVGDKQNSETCLICSDPHLMHPKEHMIKYTDDKKELQSIAHHHHIPYNELGIHRGTTDSLASSVIVRDT